jgi:hypothetical protein
VSAAVAGRAASRGCQSTLTHGPAAGYPRDGAAAVHRQGGAVAATIDGVQENGHA